MHRNVTLAHGFHLQGGARIPAIMFIFQEAEKRRPLERASLGDYTQYLIGQAGNHMANNCL